jgi:hypothetical protein
MAYKLALCVGVLSILLGGTFGLLAWATVVVAVWALAATKVSARRWMAWTGLGLGVLFSVVNLYVNGHLDAILKNQPDAGLAESYRMVGSPEESLGFNFDVYETRWNFYDEPPTIGGTPEVVEGEDGLDHFRYWIGNRTAVAWGGFEPTTENLYVVGAGTRTDYPLASKMFLHLCAVLHPLDNETFNECFSQIANQTRDFDATEIHTAEHEASWAYEGHSWLLRLKDGSIGVAATKTPN